MNEIFVINKNKFIFLKNKYIDYPIYYYNQLLPFNIIKKWQRLNKY